jgi:hypothetical protein
MKTAFSLPLFFLQFFKLPTFWRATALAHIAEQQSQEIGPRGRRLRQEEDMGRDPDTLSFCSLPSVFHLRKTVAAIHGPPLCRPEGDLGRRAAVRASRVVQFTFAAAAPATASSITAAAAATAARATVPAAALREAVPAIHRSALGRAEGNLRLLSTVAAGRFIHLTGTALVSAPGVTECH